MMKSHRRSQLTLLGTLELGCLYTPMQLTGCRLSWKVAFSLVKKFLLAKIISRESLKLRTLTNQPLMSYSIVSVHF